jgi:chemotaxis protein methyltransferase CheR
MLDAASNLPEFTADVFERFRQLLLAKSGMSFDESKLTVVRTVIQERMLTLGLTNYDLYYRLLIEGPVSGELASIRENMIQSATANRNLNRELRRLVEGLAVNETAFFRNREHYRAITEEVLPRLFRRNAETKKLRVWSAGCATGQEPYTLAIAILDTLNMYGQKPEQWNIEIIACDISEKALKIAQAGRYRAEEMRGLTDDQIRRYFRSMSSEVVATAPLDPNEVYKPGQSYGGSRYRPRLAYEIIPQVRDLIKFYFFNLVTPVYPADKFSAFDMVLCENVTIYFAGDVTRMVINNIYNSMSEGGFLFIGYSETLWQVSDRFKLINTQDTFYYQKPYPNEDTSRYVRSRPATGPLGSRTTNTGNLPPVSGRPITGPLNKPISKPILPNANTSKTDSLGTLPTPTPPSAISPRQMRPQSGGLEHRVRPGSHILNSGTLPLGSPPTPPPLPPGEPRADSPEWKVALNEGKAHMAQHEFDKALTALERALQAGTHQVEVLCAMAELKLKLGDYSAAMELCKRAIDVDRLCEPAHLMLAMIFHKEGKLNEAVQEYRYTIYVNLENVIAYVRLADIYRNTGNYRDALREYKRALAILQQKAPDEMIEDISVGILIQACKQNIARLTSQRLK